MDSPLVARMTPFGETIFSTMTALAITHDAVNLGQGFPDEDGPAEILAAAQQAIADGHNQYAPGPGVPVLRQAIADHQERFYGLSVDPDREVLVTTGATEAIAASLLALLDPGDEVVAFEPYYDSYQACVALAGGVLRTVPLTWPDLELDVERLEAACSPRTKVFLLNSPHNPLGKVFTAGELSTIGEIARRHDAVIVSDEVYEHLTFDGATHIPIASLPGLADRTLTISSAGKTFSTTGWKIGWATGPADLIRAVRTVKQYLTFTSGTPFQFAIAHGLGLGDEVYRGLTESLDARRGLMLDGLRSMGFGVQAPEGTYFIVADTAPLGVDDADALCRAMPEQIGVAAVPVSAFYEDQTLGRSLIRLAFCKDEAVLRAGLERLARVPDVRL